MHPTVRPALILMALMTIAAVAVAAEPAADQDKPLDGKELFKSSCKVCHGPKAEAGEYTPMTLIQEQWEEFFDGTCADVHAKVPAAGDAEKTVNDVLDAPMLEAIRKFCVDHAADSEQPMTCG